MAIPAAAVADAIAYAMAQPAPVDVNEIVVRPTALTSADDPQGRARCT